MESVEIPGIDSQGLRANKLTLVERLADDLAHEIKNPLHSMVINLEVLKRRVSRWSGADANDIMRYVAVVSGELERVNRRVDLLLRMIRPDRGGELMFLAGAVEEMLELVELERERQSVSIELLPPAHPPRVSVPRDTGRQVILNLLVLAMDAAAPGGTVTISPRPGAREDLLHIVAIPSRHADRTPSDGVEKERMHAAVRALSLSLGGRLEIGVPSEGPDSGTEISFALPVGTR